MPSVYELKKTLSLKAGEVLGNGFKVKDIEVRFAGEGGAAFLLECLPAKRKTEGLTGSSAKMLHVHGCYGKRFTCPVRLVQMHSCLPSLCLSCMSFSLPEG